RSPLSRTIPDCHQHWHWHWRTPVMHSPSSRRSSAGWGVFLTGSDTSSNALFAALQATAAQQIGVSDLLLVAANTTGGVTR
ncbi:hypothetical protein SU67_24895, partial [Escherichia coli O139:H28 str. E24377A]